MLVANFLIIVLLPCVLVWLRSWLPTCISLFLYKKNYWRYIISISYIRELKTREYLLVSMFTSIGYSVVNYSSFTLSFGGMNRFVNGMEKWNLVILLIFFNMWVYLVDGKMWEWNWRIGLELGCTYLDQIDRMKIWNNQSKMVSLKTNYKEIKIL